MFTWIAKPFGWLLTQFYELTGSYGLAVILFALVVKLILLPFQMKSKRSMMQTSRLTPKLKELEKKHGANKQKYNEEVQKLYREEKINPMSGCIWSLIPFPILIALYQAIRQPLTTMMGVAAELLADGGAISELLAKTGFTTTVNASYVQIAQVQWISKPEYFEQFAVLSDKLYPIDYTFLGMNLGECPQWNFLWTTNWSDFSVWGPGLLLFLIPILAAVAGYASSKISTAMNGSSADPQQGSMKTMLIIMPLFSLYIGFIMPAALGLYWLFSTLFSIIQDIFLTIHYKKKMAVEDAERAERDAAKEAELEAKRLETERRKAENATERNQNTSKRRQQRSERQEQLAKAAEWERLHNPKKREEDDSPSRVGTRRYARGRAYDPTRFDSGAVIPSDTSEIPELDYAVPAAGDAEAEPPIEEAPAALSAELPADEPADEEFEEEEDYDDDGEPAEEEDSDD